MYVVLAWTTVILAFLMLLPYIMKKLGKSAGFIRYSGYKKALKFLRTVHKPMGAVVLVTGLAHGYLALGGTIILNTNGTLLWTILLVTAVVGGIYFRTRNKSLFPVHKFLALLVVVAFLYHYLSPGPVL